MSLPPHLFSSSGYCSKGTCSHVPFAYDIACCVPNGKFDTPLADSYLLVSLPDEKRIAVYPVEMFPYCDKLRQNDEYVSVPVCS